MQRKRGGKKTPLQKTQSESIPGRINARGGFGGLCFVYKRPYRLKYKGCVICGEKIGGVETLERNRKSGKVAESQFCDKIKLASAALGEQTVGSKSSRSDMVLNGSITAN